MIASILDYIHELRISAAGKRFIRYPTRKNFNTFSILILARSRQQVARMEQHKRLV